MQKQNNRTRILGRSLALELTSEDVLRVFGGGDDDGRGGELDCKTMTVTYHGGTGPDEVKCDD